MSGTGNNEPVTVGTVTTTSNVRQLSDGNGLNGGPGTQLGQGATDKIGFYGATPVVQPNGPGEAALTRGAADGSIAIINSATASPTAVGTLTAAEYGLVSIGATASWRPTSGDVLIVNKPAAQAGMGIGNVRISSTGTLGVMFNNFTSATITPTINQSYGIVAIRGFGALSGTLTPAAVQPATIVEQQFTIAGLRSGSKALVQVMKPTAQTGLDIVGCRAVSDNLLGITFANPTAATITPTAAEVYTVLEMAGIDATTNTMLVQETAALTASANTVGSASQAMTVTGLATSDVVVGVSKPTAQANFGIVGWFVSAANSLGVTIANFAAATITPTATDVYGVTLYRPAPVGPLVVYSAPLVPASVAANTTAEQLFATTALASVVSGSMAWVNKPSATSGLGIVGVRVVGTGTIGITFANVTSAAIIPPAENYVVGNFQVPLGDAASAWVQGAELAEQSTDILANSMRAAMVSTGLMAGS